MNFLKKVEQLFDTPLKVLGWGFVVIAFLLEVGAWWNQNQITSKLKNFIGAPTPDFEIERVGKNDYSVLVTGSLTNANGARYDSWISANLGNGEEKFGRALNGDRFQARLPYIKCDTTYQYQAQYRFTDGEIIKADVQKFTTPPCEK